MASPLLMTTIIAACAQGRERSPSPAPSPDQPLRDNQVVSLYSAKNFPEEEVHVGGARIVDGVLQLLLEGYPCAVPTRIETRETGDTVAVKAFAVSYADGPCPASIVAWFVPVQLTSAIGQRELTDFAGRRIRPYSDCGADPDAPLCHAEP
jgi:hypothetical protein